MCPAKIKWLLVADIHFKQQDLGRITQTAAWIRSVAERHRVRRVVICGDLLTCRSYQPTHVLSACYRFLGSLVQDTQVAHVHVLLGNHDLAYRRDYGTTALDALSLAAPVWQLHRDVGSHVWDGRRVLMLPFREDQFELTDAVAALDRDEAAETVAFAHLAIHRAVTQRHVVRPNSCASSRRAGSVAYSGLIGPGCFSSLARTFTGHFHCHQSILQQSPIPSISNCPDEAETARLRGSVTYVGSPLQLTWADLWDEQRGVILLDPETLEHEFITNPYAVGYTTAVVEEVLRDAADPGLVRGKHVMLLGDLTPFTYAAATEKLVSLGARGVRGWRPMAPKFHGTIKSRGLGASVPASDSSLETPNLATDYEMDKAGTDRALSTCPTELHQVDIREQVQKYVEALDLDKPLENSRALLVQVGQRLLEAARSGQADGKDEALIGQPRALDYNFILQTHKADETGVAAAHMGISAQAELGSPDVFIAQPRSLTIANFLGIESIVRLEFGVDIKRGLTFLVGENGSGKSTLVEAMVWCQFGRCLRNGLGVNDVVNDKVKRDCSVRMEFHNGYAIQRFRKHKEYGNRIIVERDGKVLPEFEKADVRSTQAAINDLLGVDYDTFVRTIVLSPDSTTSFLSSTPTQRRLLILSILGLEILDRCDSIARHFSRELDNDMGQLQSKVHGLDERIDHLQGQINQLTVAKIRLETEFTQTELQTEEALAELAMTTGSDTDDAADQSMRLEEQISAAQQQVDALLARDSLAETRRAFEVARSSIQDRRLSALQHLTELESNHSQLLLAKPVAEPNTSSILSWLLDVFERLHHHLQSINAGLGSSSVRPLPPLMPRQGTRYSVRALLMALRHILAILGRLNGVMMRRETKTRKEQELRAYSMSLDDVQHRMTEQRRQLSRLKHLSSEPQLTQQIAIELNIPERAVRRSLEEVSADNAKTIPAQLGAALKTLADLQSERELRAAKRAKLVELQAAVRANSARVATYRQLIEKESAAQQNLAVDRGILRNQLATLASDRIPLDFWASALTQKRRRVSPSTSPSSSSSATSSYTFREFVLEQSLAELNIVITQILAILFEQHRHGTALTTGMLRSLFVDDSSAAETDGEEDQDIPAAALDSSLAVDARLSYGKRSGGERKRIDLALFFALLYIGHARSPHRAHYMLLDEVLDSLDAAGQAAVVTWCNLLATARVTYIVITTHSEHLVSHEVLAGESEQEGVCRGTVLTVRMGKAGVELDMDGKRIG